MHKLQVDFYILESNDFLTFSCALIEKIHHKNIEKLYIQTENQDIAEALNQKLWDFKDTSFIPHEIYNQNQLNNLSHIDVLINLTTEQPKFDKISKRILEIVPNIPEYKAAARQRYKYYLSNNFELKTHHVK